MISQVGLLGSIFPSHVHHQLKENKDKQPSLSLSLCLLHTLSVNSLVVVVAGGVGGGPVGTQYQVN